MRVADRSYRFAQTSGSASIASRRQGSCFEVTSARVTLSRTARRFARTATQTSRSRSERAVDGADDVGHRDLLGWSRQPVTAARAAACLHEPGVLQLEEDVLEELERDVLHDRELLALHGLALGGGQLERCAHGVIRLGRDPHPSIVAFEVNNSRGLL